MKILITGATGFIGRKLVQLLIEQTDHFLSLPVRRTAIIPSYFSAKRERLAITSIDSISSKTDWSEILIGCDLVIHLASRVHVMYEREENPLAAFREVNVAGTFNLARQAAQAGIRRFIYISSVKVHGEYTQLGTPFNTHDIPMPMHPYAVSKYEAEQGLMELAEKSNMEIVIVRPPLVYGPEVGGNFLRMMQLLQKRIPLPLGALNKNKRSFVSIDNLVSFILVCVTSPNAANQIFLVSDNEDLSTTELFYKVRKLLGNRTLLLPVPCWALNSAASLLRKRMEMMRITGSLQVDISKSKKLLDWQPIEKVDDALFKTVRDYMNVYYSELV